MFRGILRFICYGGAVFQTGGNKRRADYSKMWQRNDQRECHDQRRNHVHAHTDNGQGIRRHGRLYRLNAYLDSR